MGNIVWPSSENMRLAISTVVVLLSSTLALGNKLEETGRQLITDFNDEPHVVWQKWWPEHFFTDDVAVTFHFEGDPATPPKPTKVIDEVRPLFWFWIEALPDVRFPVMKSFSTGNDAM